MPAIMVAANPHWLFNDVYANKDQWFYWGYFLHLAQFKTWFPSAYYGDRLPWIIPGHIIHRMFDALAAKYIFHCGVLMVTIGAFHWLLRQAVGRQNAILGTIFFGGNAMVLSAAGSDYVDGGGAMYGLLALAFAVHASRPGGSPWWLVLAGAMAASMVYVYLFLLILAPIAILTYIFLRTRGRPGWAWWKAQCRALIQFAGGAVLVTLLLACANYYLQGSLMFQASSLREAQALLGKRNRYAAATPAWVWDAWWLLLPFAGMCAAMALLLLPTGGPNSQLAEPDRWRARLRTAFCLQTLFVWSCLLYFQWSNGVWLEITFYVTFLLPFAFLSLGVALSCTWVGVKLDRRWMWACLLLAIAAYSIRTKPLSVPAHWWAFLAAGCVAALVWKLWRPSAANIAAAWLCLLASQCFVSMQRFRMEGPAMQPLAELHASMRRMAKGSRLITAVGGVTRVLFWYEETEPLGTEFRSLMSAHLFGYSNLDTEFPTLSPDRYHELQESKAVILTSTLDWRSAIIDANRTLQDRGYKARLIKRMRVDDSGRGYDLIFVSLEKLPSQTTAVPPDQSSDSYNQLLTRTATPSPGQI